jgi:general secretion pathway protein N
MPRRIVAYVLLGIAAFVIFLVIAAPASLIEGAVARASGNTIAMTNTSGAVWRASGDLETRPAASPPLRIGRIEWTINPLWLLTGKININVSVTGSGTALTGAARIGFGSLALRNFKATFPAQLVPVFYAPAELLAPEGIVKVNSDSFSIVRDTRAEGSIELNWINAASGISNIKPLGDYRLVLSGRNASATVKLETLRGSLALTGEGQYALNPASFSFNGTGRALANAEALEPVLRMMGPKGPDGVHNFRLRWSKSQ